MTFECDCRFDNCECVVEEHRYRKVRGKPQKPVSFTCRHMKERELDHCEPMTRKNNQYCKERKMRDPKWT